jgi:glycerol-3-phosphate dehydrogenase (NAD+)
MRLFGGNPAFRVCPTPDVAGVEMAGTLKNIVALAAGFVDGLAETSGVPTDNTKATILRAGLAEMRALSQRLYPAIRTETFLEACGVGDLIASSYGGRNRRVAAAYASAVAGGASPGGPALFDRLEAELLGGQRLQGVLTAAEVAAVLAARGWAPDFPLFATVYAITRGEVGPDAILRYREVGPVQGVAAVAAAAAKVGEPVGV